MNVYWIVCLCVFIYDITAIRGNTIHINGSKGREEKRVRTDIDITIEQIEDEEWKGHEKPCVEKTLEVLFNVKNFTLWAVWIWDSIQQPVGIFYGSRSQLGNYDQCLKHRTEFRTQYCLSDIKLTQPVIGKKGSVNFYDSAALYLQNPSKYGRDFSSITWGVCMPEECTPSSVSKIMKILFKRSYLSPLANSNITVTSCERGEGLQYSTGFYIFVTMILSLMFVALLSTLYIIQNPSIRTHADLNTLQKVAKSFDLLTNCSKLVEETDDIPVINILKGLTALVVVHAHHLQLSNAYGVLNGLGLEEDLDKPITLLVKHIDIGIDHFTVISGLLLMKSLMDKEQNLIYFFIKRYVRIMAPVGVMILYFTTVSPHMGSGPLWSRLNGKEQEACLKNWWLVPLLLNNYINTTDMCQLVFWYIPNDLHLAAFGTLIYFIFRKNRIIGWYALIVASVFSIIIPGLITYWNKLPVTLIYDIEDTLDFRKNRVFMERYIKSHHRVGRYLIGMAMGYLMSAYKSAHYRRLINPIWSIIILTLNVLLGTSIWVFGGFMIGWQYDHVEAAIFVTIANTFYAVSICIAVFIFEYGTVLFLSDIFKLPLFTVLSRLSYCIFVVHIAIVQRNVFSTRIPGKYDISMIFDGTGVFVLAAIISFGMWLLVERPLTSLCNVLGPRINTQRSEEYKSKNIEANPDVKQKNGAEKYKLL